MSQVIAAVLILGLAASFSPVVIATSAGLTGSPTPLPSGAAFLSGVAAATLVAEIVILALLQGVGSALDVRDRPVVTGTVSIALGAVTIWFGLKLWQPKTAEEEVPDIGNDAAAGVWKLFALGFTLMIANVRAIAMIGAAINEIYAADVVIYLVMLALVLLTIVVILLPAVPLLVYYFSPQTAARIPELEDWIKVRGERVLNPVKSGGHWIWERTRPAAAVISGLVGLSLIARGVEQIIHRLA